MSISLVGQVGPQILQDGTAQSFRQGKAGEMSVSENQGRYYEVTYRGLKFNASNQAAVTAPTALTASSVNFTLYNPLGSGVNLVVSHIDIVAAQVAETTAGTYQVLLVANTTPSQAAPATVTALTPQSNLLGSGKLPQAKVYSTATLAATPTVIKPLLSLTNQIALGPLGVQAQIEIAGSIIVTPGNYISVQGISTTETTAPGLTCGMTWDEIPT